MFSLLFLPLLIALGFWQLHRAEQKHTLQELLSERQDLPPLQWSSEMSLETAQLDHLYRKVVMNGQFDQQKFWLLENRILQGRLGYEVIVPFYLADGGAVLVNRGWFPGTGYRDQLPLVPPTENTGSVVGQLVTPSRNALLKPQPLSADWPQTTLQINTDNMQPAVEAPLLPWVLQLDPQHPAALEISWSNINMPHSKHLGYAWQWFSMALALLVLSVFANSNLGQLLSQAKKKKSL